MRALLAIFSFMFKRLFLVGFIIVAQASLLGSLVLFASYETFYGYIFFHAVSFVVVMFIVANSEKNPSYKITWIVLIMLVPLLGGMFYFLFGNKRIPRNLRIIAQNVREQTRENMPPNVLEEQLWDTSPASVLQCHYIYNMSGYPAWEDNFSQYYTLGEDMFESMLAEIARARRYIFLEYFIIAPGQMWDRLFELLRAKVKDGVEVRLMYDDLGCIRSLPRGYNKTIRAAGIKLCVFNPFRPHLSPAHNYRDHRKLCIIDGLAAFCGGINIADEYINKYEKHGHWKDTGVLIKGPAVWGFAFMFLQLWEIASGKKVRYGKYRVEQCQQMDASTRLPASGEWSTRTGSGGSPPRTGSGSPPPQGFVQVFGDSPLEQANVTQTTYHSILSRATRYVYITTPYLVIDYETQSVLCAAAESGIDVRIITPHKYDKWYVHVLTRAHYARLIKSGVRIFEYTPGFMHGKTYVSDDKVCMVGTCNMDFRSFFLHFECSAAFYSSGTVLQVRDDFLRCLEVSREVTLPEVQRTPLRLRALRAVLKLFAPLF